MTIERALRGIAGVVVGAGTVLAALHSPWWLILTGFAALNLAQSAITDWCPMVWVLQKAGFRRCAAGESKSAA
jgi:hypothetical protein